MGSDQQPPVHRELVRRILEGDGRASPEWRRAAFHNSGPDEDGIGALVDKVATRPTQVTDDDFRTATRAGLTDDQLWELVICAAVGQSTRQYEAARAALSAAIEERRS